MQLRTRMENLIEEMLDGQILLNEAMAEFEKIYIQRALERHDRRLDRALEPKRNSQLPFDGPAAAERSGDLDGWFQHAWAENG